jgi:LPXTG-motif cell wall-anchored protein
MAYPTYTHETPQRGPRPFSRARGIATGVAVAAAGAAVALALWGGTANADPAPTVTYTPTPEQTGGHQDPANVTTCDGAGLSGDILLPPDSDGNSAVVSVDGTSVTITIAAGFTVDGIVVKGGPGYNVYHGPFVGPAIIPDLTSPPDAGIGGNIPTISHFFVCGSGSPVETTTTTTTTNPCDQAVQDCTTSTPNPCDTGVVINIVAPTCTTPPPTSHDPCATATTVGVPGAVALTPTCPTTTPKLPKTGESLTGFLVAGAALVIVGAGTLLVLRRRRATTE